MSLSNALRIETCEALRKVVRTGAGPALPFIPIRSDFSENGIHLRPIIGKRAFCVANTLVKPVKAVIYVDYLSPRGEIYKK